ncbi:MAG: hypothetical protein ACRC06_07100 [Waterburya sp.]
MCRYWYNRQLGERFDWWSHNRSYIDRCSISICHLVVALPSTTTLSRVKFSTV